MANRKVIAEGSGKAVSRLVKYHHEARVAIVIDGTMLELTENGYGDWELVQREYGSSTVTARLAKGSVSLPS